jgi:UPF0755 protein
MRRLLLLSLLMMAALAGAGTWLWRDMQRQLREPLAISGAEILIVAPGTTMRALATDLARRGWLARPLYLELEARRSGRAARIHAGEYAVTPGTTPLDLLDMLVRGRVLLHAMTIVEGWTFRELRAAVAANPVLRQTLIGVAPDRIMAELGYAGYLPEGRFLPDTYRFPAGTTDAAFLRRAFRAMTQVLDEEWAARDPDLPYESPYQALIMASLVEKETAVPAERARIAGVFVRRLRQGMRLQTDPTVIYALGERFDGNIRRRDLDLDSPYNTYRVTGLPPTPIALPGREAIRAALHPEPGDALYFVARGDGTHEFTANLEEHNRAVRKYQLRAGR